MADENICFRRVVAISPRCAHRFEEIAPGLTPTFNMEWHAALRLRILKFYTLEKEFGPHTFFQRPFRLGKLQARDDANQTHEEEKCLGTLNADGTLTPPSDTQVRDPYPGLVQKGAVDERAHMLQSQICYNNKQMIMMNM